MYGILLRLDSGRQQRVGADPLSKLLSPEIYSKVKTRRSPLNASTAVTSPFAPTLVRPSFYPDYFRATDIRTLFWMVRNHPEMHGLQRVYVDEKSRIVFQFDVVDTSTMPDALSKVLQAHGHFEFVDRQVSGNSISFAVKSGFYSSAEAGE